jgi:hypothetical protein
MKRLHIITNMKTQSRDGWRGGEGRMNQPRDETWLRHRWCEEPPQDSG